MTVKLVASPTFKAKVPIPVPGGKPIDVEMTFKHRRRKDFLDWQSKLEGKENVTIFLEMVEAWELEVPFTPPEVENFLEDFMGCGIAAYDKYCSELVQAKRGN